MLFLLYLAAGFLSKGHLYGSLFGLMAEVVLIMIGAKETGQIIKETPFGVILIIYYLVLLLITKRKNRKSQPS